jgi:hypothetical protein
MLTQTSDAPWRGHSVLLYDRCVSPDDPLLADRLAQCRRYAAEQGCPVIAERVDYGRPAKLDGRGESGWLDVAALRGQLCDAVRECQAAGAWLLVWHPDRISSYSACRRVALNALSGRVLRVGRGVIKEGSFALAAGAGAP